MIPSWTQNVFRNLGTVDKYGIDASIAWQVIPQLQIYVYGSYLWSKIQDNVLAGECTATVSASCPAVHRGRQRRSSRQTAGRRESGAAGLHVRRPHPGPARSGRAVASRPSAPVRATSTTRICRSACAPTRPAATLRERRRLHRGRCAGHSPVYGAQAPAYTTVDIGARVPLGWAGLNDDTYFQFNVTNVFDKLYVGNVGGELLNTSVPFVQIGAPRAFIVTLNVAFR